MERRNFIKLASGLVAAGIISGCGGSSLARNYYNDDGVHVSSGGPYTDNGVYENEVVYDLSKESVASHKPYVSKYSNAPAAAAIAAVSRNSWKAGNPIASRLRSMGGVSRITIHHEGNPKANWDSSPGQVAKTLRKIQSSHRKRMRAADIGYHYVVDRKGRIWEGRDTRYQGAHISKKNAHNIGIMLLGNFDIQRPTTPQLNGLENLCKTLMRGYGVSIKSVGCHGELANTRCPGKHMRSKMTTLRRELKRSL